VRGGRALDTTRGMTRTPNISWEKPERGGSVTANTKEILSEAVNWI
jgi:hypothetical protein